MFATRRYISIKQGLSIVVALAVTIGLILGLVARPVGATSLASVSSNVAEIPASSDTNFIMKVRAHNDGDLAVLEVDHSLEDTLPEFSVYANESNPYGDDASEYVAAGLTVSYSASLSEWTFEFDRNGPAWNAIEAAGQMTFYFVLKDINGQELWGTMNGTTAENTFAFDFNAGTGDELVYVPVAEEDNAAETPGEDSTAPAAVVIPGVPNTSAAF